MWTRLRTSNDAYQFEEITNEYINLRSCFSRRKSLQYKNRSLAAGYSAIDRTANFFNFKGRKLHYYKLLAYSNLFFFYNLLGVATPKNLQNKYTYNNFAVDLESLPVLNKLFIESDYFMDFNMLIPYFLNKDLPMLKATITIRKFLKKKKPKNRLKSKYSVRYVYVPHAQRIQVSMRWFGMMVKITNPSIINSFLENTLNIADEASSFVVKPRNPVYLGLTAQSD